MRGVFALVLTLSLTAVGCSTSDVDPDATVRISGRALDAAGKPLADTTVLLFKDADLGEVVLGTVLAIGTLSTVCLLPDPPAVCAQARTVTTDSDGRYAFELKGSDTQGTLGSESTLNIVFGTDRSSTAVSFVVKDTEVGVPDARLWRARASLAAPIDLSWSPLPEAAGDDVSYAALVFDAESGAPVYSQPADGDHTSVDPRVLEDQQATVAASASASLSGGRATGDVHVSYLSARLPAGTAAGAPPSRGDACAPVVGSKARIAAPAPGCPMTDGDLASPAHLDAGGKAVVSGVVIDLGEVRPVDLVVVREFAGQILVELSTDGHTFRTVATELGATVAVEPPGAPSARYVRVRSPSGLDESLAAEVSVW